MTSPIYVTDPEYVGQHRVEHVTGGSIRENPDGTWTLETDRCYMPNLDRSDVCVLTREGRAARFLRDIRVFWCSCPRDGAWCPRCASERRRWGSVVSHRLAWDLHGRNYPCPRCGGDHYLTGHRGL